jgi:hypothetical protein
VFQFGPKIRKIFNYQGVNAFLEAPFYTVERLGWLRFPRFVRRKKNPGRGLFFDMFLLTLHNFPAFRIEMQLRRFTWAGRGGILAAESISAD